MARSEADLATELTRVIDRESGAMRDLLAALVAVPTENPPGRSYPACVELIERALDSLSIAHERVGIPNADAHNSAVFGSVGRTGPTLYLHGHYDVVPASAPGQFAPLVEGDTLFGRGSSDMKSGLVAMLYAAHALQSLGLPSRGRIGLVFVPDEETGGSRGSGALAAAGLLGRDAIGMLLPEPTSGVVWHANRGAFTLEVTVKGRHAHVGLMHQGVNAFERAVSVVNELIALERSLAPAGSLLLVGGRVEAGVNFNSVPAECRFTVDRRTNPDEDFDAEKQRLLDLLERARQRGVDLETRIIQEGRPASTAPESELGRVLADAVHVVTGEAPRFELCPGLLEIRFYAAQGVPALSYGPGVLAVSHGPQEFVRISRMIECAKIYALTAARLLT